MSVIRVSEVIRSNRQKVALFRDSLCWKNFLLQIQSGVIKHLLALEDLVVDHRFSNPLLPCHFV